MKLLGYRWEKSKGRFRGWLIIKDGKRLDFALNRRNALRRVREFINAT